MRSLVISTAMVFFSWQALCDARIYRLVESSILEGREFGYSGTLTTDGSLGLLTNTDFLQSWSIDILTPSDPDGISWEQLTPENSSLSLNLGPDQGLEVDETTIQFPLRLSGSPYATLTWTGPTSRLQFGNRSPHGSVGVYDMNTGIGVIRDERVIARLVPEPITLLLAMFAAGLLLKR